MTLHFEQLWEEAEQVAEKAPTARDELFIKLKYEIEEYAKLDNIPSKEIQNILKTKKLGEILFKIAELSKVDNINTFAALQLEVQYLVKKD
jgi:hypothetical protein